jgi:magnesium transporter
MAEGEPVAEVDARPWDQLHDLAQAGDGRALGAFIETLPTSEAVRGVSRLDSDDRGKMFAMLSPQQAAVIVGASPESQAREIIGQLPAKRAASILHELPSAQVVDIIAGVDEAQVAAILREMRPEEAAQAERLAKYESDEAGGLMITEFLSYPEQYTAGQVLDDMRDNAERYVNFDVQYAYCVSSFGDLVGVLRMRDLVLMPRGRKLIEFMIRTPVSVNAHTPLDDLQTLFEERAFLGVPVVDDGGRLVGVVKRGDVESALSKRAGSDYLKSQGIIMGEELRTMPVRVRSSRRLAWLTLNIGLNMFSASAIAIFQGTLEQVIALAVFLPIISDMSGCAGNQAVAVSMRELTLGMIKPRELMHVWWKEVQVGLINGLVLGLLIAAVAVIWKGNGWLGLVVGGALAINTLVAVTVGGLLPLILKMLRRDPALAAGPILTTVTDMFGFFLALGFATILLSKLVAS